MMYAGQKQTFERLFRFVQVAVCLLLLLVAVPRVHGQADQGAITGLVQDTTGAVIPNAQVTLTNVDTGLTLHGQTDASGNYVFSPVKIGTYKVQATAAGFSPTVQENIQLHVQDRVEANLQLKTGSESTEVTVSTAPALLQTEEGSTGQVIESKTINDTPLNGRNWIFIAQLTAGVAPANGARGQKGGDFNANGQRAEQNNYIMDGVDNNVNVVDFFNGASYVVRPPPDALAEFKVQTDRTVRSLAIRRVRWSTPASSRERTRFTDPFGSTSGTTLLTYVNFSRVQVQLRNTAKTSLAQRSGCRFSRTSSSFSVMWKRTVLCSGEPVPA